jgi:hypothetical protein
MYSQNEILVLLSTLARKVTDFSLEIFHFTKCLTISTSPISCLVLYQYPNVTHCCSLLCHFALIHTFVESHSLYQHSGFNHEMPSN